MEEQMDPPWQSRERELRFAESAICVATAADRMVEAINGLRKDIASTPAERLTRTYPRQAVVLFVVLVGVASLVGACVGLAFGGAS
jgi:hypothetical protein